MSYVMIVEDDKSIRETLGFYLTSMNKINHYLAAGFDDVQQILNAHGKPKLVFLDYLLNGDDFERIIQILDRADVILMTASHEGEKRYPEFGLRQLLRKPFTIYELEEILKQID